MTKSLTFHQTVTTPNGPGIVQGMLRKSGEPDRIIVSHSWQTAAQAGLVSGKINGIWNLQHYAMEDLE